MLSLFFLLFAALLFHVDRTFLKFNKGFCLHYISADLSFRPEWEIPIDSLQWAEQKFYYLNKGHQSFVFLSEDNKYVFKCYRFPSHLRLFPSLKHPLSYHFSTKRRQVKQYNLDKLNASFASYKIAYEQLRAECGLLAVHLNKTAHLHKTIHLVDHLGHEYDLPLDDLYFVVQQKGELIFPYLSLLWEQGEREKMERMLKNLALLVKTTAEKGIVNEDPILEKNYGWLNETPFHLDVGRFAQKDFPLPQKEITAPLIPWLKERDPALCAYLEV